MYNMKKNYLFLLMIFIFGMFMSIGWATISEEHLYINGTATAAKMTGVFISQAYIVGTSNGSRINAYGETVLNSRVVLDANDETSNLIINVTVINDTNEVKAFDKIIYDSSFYDNINIVVDTNGSLVYGTLIPANSSVSFNVIFSYDSNYTANNSAPYDNILNGIIRFKFGKSHSITYVDINGSGYPSSVIEGETLNVNFGGNAPDDVEVTGNSSSTTYTKDVDYTYNNGVLVFANVTEALTVKGLSNGPTVIHDITTTVYNHNNLTPDTTTLFEAIAGQPLVTVDANGIITSFEYTDVGTGVVFTPGSSFDTGVNAFVAASYTIHLKYKMNTSQNIGKYILTALKRANGNRYQGFTLLVYQASQVLITASNTGANLNQTIFGTRLGNGWTVGTDETVYTFDMTYVPSPNKAITASLLPVSGGDSNYIANTNQLSYYPDSINDVSFVLGGTGVNTSKDVSNMTVLEFSISVN